MDLTEEQKAAVAGWVRAGASLSDVQKRLAENFDVSMTYMDVRFLVDDLDLDLTDPDAGSSEVEAASPAETTDPSPAADVASETVEPELLDETDAAGGAVSVSVDRVQRPGAVVSGSVRFSDGVNAQWQVDQFGQLGIIPPEGQSGYRPSEGDLREFQMALQREMQKQGF
ncbi:MAG: hypothetical protein ACFB20_00625 [Opitutales bacterium]